MGRTLLELATRMADDIDEKTTDMASMAKIKRYINRYYKDVAKRQKENEISVIAIEGVFTKPSYCKKGVQLLYKDEKNRLLPIDFKEYGSIISTSKNGDLTFIYELDYEALPDLTDDDTPETFAANDEIIMSGAKYIYWKSEDKYNKAEIEKRDYETSNIKKPVKQISVTTYR
jgi:hypothetical protein